MQLPRRKNISQLLLLLLALFAVSVLFRHYFSSFPHPIYSSRYVLLIVSCYIMIHLFRVTTSGLSPCTSPSHREESNTLRRYVQASRGLFFCMHANRLDTSFCMSNCQQLESRHTDAPTIQQTLLPQYLSSHGVFRDECKEGQQAQFEF